MRLCTFPRYTQKGPSSRYRVFQYLPYFDEYEIRTSAFFGESYLPTQTYSNIKGVSYLAGRYANRLINLLKVKKGDIVFVQYEFTPFLPFNLFYFKLRNIKYVVDFDDAAFHDYDQHKNKLIRFLFKNKISTVMKYASHIITGSPYLTEYAMKFNSNVTEIPTSIDFNKYKLKEKSDGGSLIIGWIGSKTTSWNLLSMIPALYELQKKGVKFEIRCIGFNVEMNHHFTGLPFQNIPWSSETEILEIQKFDVGIMPLGIKLFNYGKCAFKLIQYMACGIPTISTPLEANKKVDRNNENLFASNNKEWCECFLKIKNEAENYEEVGNRNRDIIKKYYSIQENYKKYLSIFENLKEY